jgi:hypothetical protein
MGTLYQHGNLNNERSLSRLIKRSRQTNNYNSIASLSTLLSESTFIIIIVIIVIIIVAVEDKLFKKTARVILQWRMFYVTILECGLGNDPNANPNKTFYSVCLLEYTGQ